MTEALDPVMRAAGGTWVAWGSGDADFDGKVVDKDNRVKVPPPPEESKYTLRRVKLSEADVAGFYLGFANEALWPLCHVTFTPPDFRQDWWHTYQQVNRTFADAVIGEISKRKAAVLVQDYHFALLSHYLKQGNPNSRAFPIECRSSGRETTGTIFRRSTEVARLHHSHA